MASGQTVMCSAPAVLASGMFWAISLAFPDHHSVWPAEAKWALQLRLTSTSACCRDEEKQEAREAAAFDDAMQAKALVKTWKRPRLTPGQSALPIELWSLVLDHMLAGEPLWDLRATVQGLCHVSLTCKGLYQAVQQHGWSKLGQLLSPLPVPPPLRGKGNRLLGNADVPINDPASLRVAELKAACTSAGLKTSGQSALLAPDLNTQQLMLHSTELGVCMRCI